MEIYSIEGRLVRTLVNEIRPAGDLELRWDGRNNRGSQVASGTYFCRMLSDGEVDTAKMVMLK